MEGLVAAVEAPSALTRGPECWLGDSPQHRDLGLYREQGPSPEETRLPDGITESAVGQASLSAKPWSPKLSCNDNMWAVTPSSTPLQAPKKMSSPFQRQLPNAVTP